MHKTHSKPSESNKPLSAGSTQRFDNTQSGEDPCLSSSKKYKDTVVRSPENMSIERPKPGTEEATRASNSSSDRPLVGGKQIKPEDVHDRLGHPTLGGTYPAGTRFSKRIKERKSLARATSPLHDLEIALRRSDSGVDGQSSSATDER